MCAEAGRPEKASPASARLLSGDGYCELVVPYETLSLISNRGQKHQFHSADSGLCGPERSTAVRTWGKESLYSGT